MFTFAFKNMSSLFIFPKKKCHSAIISSNSNRNSKKALETC